MHYCMGKLADITYHVSEQSNHCDNCGMEDSDCCHNNVEVVKLENVQHAVKAIDYKLPAIKPVLQAHHYAEAPLLQHYSNGIKYYNDPPPGSSSKPFSVLYCVFRI